MKNKKELEQIASDLTEKIKKRDTNLAGGYYNNEPLIDLVIKLRCQGVKIELPNVYIENPIYCELASEIVRNLQVHIHPIRSWFIQHVDVIIASFFSLVSLIISIIAAV